MMKRSGGSYGRVTGAFIGCLGLCVFCCTAPAQDVDPTAPPRGKTYASIQELPDWQGWWGPLSLPAYFSTIWGIIRNAPFEPTSRAELDAMIRGNDITRGSYCRPTRFVGLNGGRSNVEFLFTPGRVTLTNESGLIRRIYTDGRRFPEAIEESNAGTSVGHWEGQSLVVTTVGLDANAGYPYDFANAPRIGKGARIEERIHLSGKDVLEIDSTLTAPQLLTSTLHVTWRYVRLPRHVFHEDTSCVDDDRSIDPVTGQQRFDMTPPSDLPPPPKK